MMRKMMKFEFTTHHSLALNFLKTFDSFLLNHLNTFKVGSFSGQKKLLQAIKYSLFSGGKRFRPLLIFSIAEVLSIKNALILPWAGAIEMVHTASLIHDDLPCMDNSSYRRNKATNHRLFGEDIALLAGDCLWVEAFRLVNSQTEWVKLLCQACGFHGLMGGQALDLYPLIKKEKTDKYYKEMHTMKTASLISSSVQGVLVLKKEKTNDLRKLKQIGDLIGQAFQLSDDLQDFKDTGERSNFAVSLGQQSAQKELKMLSRKTLDLIAEAGFSHSLLNELVIFNQKRCETSTSVA